jgi:hypothetical protein
MEQEVASRIFSALNFLGTFPNVKDDLTPIDLRDGTILLKCFHHISPNHFPLESLASWKTPVTNINDLCELIEEYYKNSLNKTINNTFPLDAEAIAKDGSVFDLLPLIELAILASCACENKALFIKDILKLNDIKIQSDLKILIEDCKERCDTYDINRRNRSDSNINTVADIYSEELLRTQEMLRHLHQERAAMENEVLALREENKVIKSKLLVHSNNNSHIHDNDNDNDNDKSDSKKKMNTENQEDQDQDSDQDTEDDDDGIIESNIDENDKMKSLEYNITNLQRVIDKLTIDNENLIDTNKKLLSNNNVNNNKILSLEIQIKHMTSELDNSRNKSIQLIKSEGLIIKLNNKINDLNIIKNNYYTNLELLDEYSNRISELETKSSTNNYNINLIEKLNNNIIINDREIFDIKSQLSLKEHEIIRLETENKVCIDSKNRIELEMKEIRDEFEKIVLAGASDGVDSATTGASGMTKEQFDEYNELKSKVTVLQRENEIFKNNGASDGSSSISANTIPTNDTEQELLFIKAQLDLIKKEKKNREDNLIDCKKQLATAAFERKRIESSLKDAQEAISSANIQIKLKNEYKKKYDNITNINNINEDKIREKDHIISKLEQQRKELELFSKNKLESFKNKFMTTLKAVQAEKEVVECSLQRLVDRTEFDRETKRREERLLLSAMYSVGVKIMDRNLQK